MPPALTNGGWGFGNNSEWRRLCLVLLSSQPGQSSLSSSRTLALGTYRQCKALEGWEHSLTVDAWRTLCQGWISWILEMAWKKDAYVHLKASSLGWSPSGSHLLGAVREEEERQKTPRAEGDLMPHPLSVSALSDKLQTVLPCWGSRTFQHPALEDLKSIRRANEQS